MGRTNHARHQVLSLGKKGAGGSYGAGTARQECQRSKEIRVSENRVQEAANKTKKSAPNRRLPSRVAGRSVGEVLGQDKGQNIGVESHYCDQGGEEKHPRGPKKKKLTTH